VIPKQVVADQLQEPPGQFSLAPTDDLRHRDAVVVVRDAPRNPAEELKGLDMPVPAIPKGMGGEEA
jgi:hypothetical protein